jgi:predicted transcriptional regulator
MWAVRRIKANKPKVGISGMLSPGEATGEAGGSRQNYRGLAAEIVSAYVSHNPLPSRDVPRLLGEIHAALKRLGSPSLAEPPTVVPAIPIRGSIRPDALTCLEDGKLFKSLKRHLRVRHGMTPDEYRSKWGLPSSYPMVAPNYSTTRSVLAKQSGLGRKPSGDRPRAARAIRKAKPEA